MKSTVSFKSLTTSAAKLRRLFNQSIDRSPPLKGGGAAGSLIPLTCLYFTSLKLQQQTYVRIFMKVEKRRRNLPASGESLCVETQIKLNTGQRFNWVKAIALEPVAYAGGNPPALDSPLTRDDHFPYITCQGSESITQKHSSAPYLANASTYAAYGKAA